MDKKIFIKYLFFSTIGMSLMILSFSELAYDNFILKNLFLVSGIIVHIYNLNFINKFGVKRQNENDKL